MESRYFYEMLAYAHQGNMVGRMTMPKKHNNTKIPSLSRRLKVKNPDVLMQLLQDEQFKEYAKRDLTTVNVVCWVLAKREEERKRPNNGSADFNTWLLSDSHGFKT